MIVLSGSHTLLGSYLLPILRDRHLVCAFDSERGDIRDRSFVEQLLNEVRPDVFINCAQNDNIEECEYKREDAYTLNGTVPAMIADICTVKKIRLVQISSVMVFDCIEGSVYKEQDPLHPVTVYGDSKAYAEKTIAESGCSSLIVRVPHLYGKGESFLSPIIEKIKDSNQITIPTGQMIMPTYAADAASMIATLVEKRTDGIIHCANDASVSIREFIFEFASRFSRATGKSYIANVLECEAEDFLTPYDTPMSPVFDISRMKSVFGFVRRWEEALAEFVENNSQYI
jgi:dTDP-4-dehydrorhamnose reductase